jgi:hypothetical protein
VYVVLQYCGVIQEHNVDISNSYRRSPVPNYQSKSNKPGIGKKQKCLAIKPDIETPHNSYPFSNPEFQAQIPASTTHTPSIFKTKKQEKNQGGKKAS